MAHETLNQFINISRYEHPWLTDLGRRNWKKLLLLQSLCVAMVSPSPNTTLGRLGYALSLPSSVPCPGPRS